MGQIKYSSVQNVHYTLFEWLIPFLIYGCNPLWTSFNVFWHTLEEHIILVFFLKCTAQENKKRQIITGRSTLKQEQKY